MLRALTGHKLMHCMQEIQAVFTHLRRLSGRMAPTGHFSAHNPQPVQVLSAAGWIGRTAYGRYGLFPGKAVEKDAGEFPEMELFFIMSWHWREKRLSSSISFLSGRPEPYFGMIECLATAAAPPKHRNPADSTVSFNSMRVSS